MSDSNRQVINSIVAAYDGSNVTIGMHHTPSNAMTIERADLADACLMLFRFCSGEQQRQLLTDMWRWVEP